MYHNPSAVNNALAVAHIGDSSSCERRDDIQRSEAEASPGVRWAASIVAQTRGEKTGGTACSLTNNDNHNAEQQKRTGPHTVQETGTSHHGC